MIQPVYASKFFAKLDEKEREAVRNAGIVPINDIYFPYFGQYHRHKIFYGGRGSGKSKFIAQDLIYKCANSPYFKYQYSRKHQVDIKESQYELLKQTISEFKMWRDFAFNASTLRITHRTGNCFIAKGLDDPEKSKGIPDLNGFWGEEITEFEQEDIVGINQNLRTTKGPLESVYSFNPIHEMNWVRSYFFTESDRHRMKTDFQNSIAVHSTLYHNHFINQEQYAQELIAGASGDPNIIRVVLDGDWGLTENGNPWLHAFDMNKHVREVPFLLKYPVYITFDINADPLSCTVWQMSPSMGTNGCFLHCIDEFGGHIKVEDICQQIRATYPSSIIFITGDRSGQNQDVGRNQTIYQIVQSLLGLSDKQLHLNTHNLEHADSRLLCNAMFTHYPVLIHPKCKNLIADCQKATVDIKSSKPSQLLKDRGIYKMDYFDGMRYLYQTYFNKYISENYLNILNKRKNVSIQQQPGIRAAIRA